MNQNFIQNSIAGVMPSARASGLFVSLCTIQQPDGILIDAGQPSGNYTDVTGLVDIACMNAPNSEIRIEADEDKAIEQIQEFAPKHVLLDRYYEVLSADNAAAREGWIAIIDGITYDLLGCESDSQAQMTRIAVRVNGL